MITSFSHASHGMSVLVEDAAWAFVSTYLETNDLHRVDDWRGQRVQRAGVGDALMKPMGVVELPEGVEQVRWFLYRSRTRRRGCDLEFRVRRRAILRGAVTSRRRAEGVWLVCTSPLGHRP